jgi:hypothetical protein
VVAIDVAAAQAGVVFQGNAYWSTGAPLAIRWGGAVYGSLGDLRAATGQERLGSIDTGVVADPLLEAPGGGGTIGDADRLADLVAYRPRAASPLLDAGLNLSMQFGIDAGGRDFGGVVLPQAEGYDIGAVERPTQPGDANRDGTVNFDDLLILAKNYNGTGRSWSQADFTGDGLVNFDDLLVLAKNYNRSIPLTGAPDRADTMPAAATPPTPAVAARPTSPRPSRRSR